MPSFIPDAATPDPLPSLSNPDPLIARLQNFPLAPSPSTSSRLSFFSSPKPKERYLHGLAMYTPKTANKSRHVNVLLHGYGAALGFFAFGNLQAFGEESARTGRKACESCPSPLLASSRFSFSFKKLIRRPFGFDFFTQMLSTGSVWVCRLDRRRSTSIFHRRPR